MATRKVVIRNDIYDELRNKYEVRFGKVEAFDEDKFFDPLSPLYLPRMTDTAFLILGYDTYQRVRDLHNKHEIHIGLRNFNYETVKNIAVVRIANGIKFIFSAGIIDKSPDWEKIEYFIEGDLDKEPPKLKEFDILDLKEVDIGLQKLGILNPSGEFLGLDFESKSLPLQSDFIPLGLSIVGSNYGFYVNMRDYQDYLAPEYKSLRSFIETNFKRLVTFNCAFEIRALEHMWGEMLLVQDAWALCLCDDERSGLKAQAQHYLSVPSWDDSLEEEQLFFNKLMHGGVYRGETWDPCPDSETFFKRLKDPKYSERYGSNLSRIMNECINRRIEEQNIYEEDVAEFTRQVKQEYKERIKKWWGNEWSMCDAWTLGKYCCYDSFYTKLIWDKLHGVYPRAEEPYHNNFYYGAFLESTGIPINTEKLFILQDYLHKVQVNTGIFYLRFYKYCLEDVAGSYVDSLHMNEYLQNLIADYAWMLSLSPDKVLKELLKACVNKDIKPYDPTYPDGGIIYDNQFRDSPGDEINWKKFAKYTGVDLGRKVWNLVKNDIDKNTGTFTVASACRRHRNDWIALGEEFKEVTDYQGLIERINDRNLSLARDSMKQFNKSVKEFVAPLNPLHTKLVAWYHDNPVEDKERKIKKGHNPWLVKYHHPECSGAYDFVSSIYEKWMESYNRGQYLEGKEFKKVLAFITTENLESWRHSFNIHQDLPPVVLRECPFNMISVEQVANLIQLRHLEPTLAKWDNLKIDDPLPEGVDYDYARWLALDMVQWSSDKKYFVVVQTMLQKYGWMCSAITQFWNYWWSPDHVKEEDPVVLDYVMRHTRDDDSNWVEDAREYIYQSGDNYKKTERCVGLENFSVRFGFEKEDIRQWRQFDVNKDTKLNIERNEDKLIEDWDNLYKFFVYWDMGQASDKQLNPYIEGDKGMIENSWKLDKTLRDGSEIIDYSQHGNRFMTRFKICGVIGRCSSKIA